LQIQIVPHYGTDLTGSGAQLNTWHDRSGSDYLPDYAQNWSNTASATFDVTGVQLEVGEKATPFEHRTQNDELARCQRYFQVIAQYAAMPGTTNGSSQIANVGVPLARPMRAAPTASSTSYVTWHSSADGVTSNTTAMTVSTTSASNTTYRGTIGDFSGLTDNRVATVVPNNALQLSAEL
jgi:hypothetical protein